MPIFDFSGLGWRIHQLTRTVWGEKSIDSRKERAIRLLEEALELAQAEGIPEMMAERLAYRVYRRPMGDPRQEITGVAFTFIAYCEALCIPIRRLTGEEINRLNTMDVTKLRAKYIEKIRDGITFLEEKDVPCD